MKKSARKTTSRKTKVTASAVKKPAKKAKKRRTSRDTANKSKAVPRARARKSAARSDIDNLGELPRSYGDNRMFVIAQEPHRLFCYWDYQLTDSIGSTVFLRHGREGREREGETPVPSETNSWYLAVHEADADYAVELGYYKKGVWQQLSRSGTVLTPSDKLAGYGDPVFANAPFHDTFRALVEKLRGQMRRGESLAAALGRMQKNGALPFSRLSPSQRSALDTIMQTQLGSLSSGDLGRFLSSPAASLFSGGFAPGSWAHTSSWSDAPGGLSGSSLALLGPGGTPWGNTPSSGATSSWAAGALSSWGPESSSLSSWAPTERGFFMHVNAEVIFYGGTHPDAELTVDGQPVRLRPDGTFRHHFVLPDGEFEIPIIATSPDGMETRRAVLTFERTTKRHGDIGASTQPPFGTPKGRKK